jgi:acyl-coenzyme A thioesterase PaaI-like protein
VLDDSPDGESRAAAGAAIRRLGHSLVGHEADIELLDEVAATIDDLTGRLDAGSPRQRPPDSFGGKSWTDPLPQGIVGAYDDRPFSGRSSPWGLDLEVHRRGDEVQGLLTLGAAHEGAPGRSHGGIVAGLFDDVFGFVLGILQQPAYTGELVVRYERPTPLQRQLACRGRLAERDGRKLWIEGELVDVVRDEVVARGRGLFITVSV